MSGRIAVVLGGGGARGAYEAGALSVLLPELERLGERPAIFTGTSVGALNAAFLAASAHRPAAETAARAQAIWSGVEYGDVLEPLVSAGAIGRIAGYLGEALGLPRTHLWSLLDASPLARTLPRHVDFGQIARNVADGTVHAAAVAATSARTSRSIVFHQGGSPVEACDDRRGIDYVATAIEARHVLASSAIPSLFAAIELDGEWYVDGGTRLNTPVKPALALGADRVLVVALNSLAPGDTPARPDALVGGGAVLQALLADQLLHDVRTLETINALVGDRGEVAGRRRVPYALVTPQRPDTVGALAAEVFQEHFTSVGETLRERDMAALGRALGGARDAAHGELLSYLFFAPEFTTALLELGRRDAESLLASGPLWTDL